MGTIRIDKVVRTKRRTVALSVNAQAEVVVRAPKRLPQRFIDAFVARHSGWIEQKKEKALARKAPERLFTEGERLPYRGETFPLSFVRTLGRGRVDLREGVFLIEEHALDPKLLFEMWYKKRAKEILVPKAVDLARRHGYVPNTVRVTGARTRFGSCSGRKNISLSWRLILFPDHIAEYVIIHELVHLEHMDHSRAFWERVSELCPEYRMNKKELSEGGIWSWT